MNKIGVYGYVLLAFSVLVGALVPIAFSMGSAIPFTTLLFYVSITGVVTSFTMMILRGTSNQLKDLVKDRTFLFSIGLLALLVNVVEPLGLSYATHFITADLTSVLYRTWTILIILVAPFVLREKMTKWDIAAVSVGFLALAATVIGGTAISIPASELPYVGAVLIVAIGIAFANAISKRYNYELTISTFCYNVIGLAVFAPLAIFTNSWQLTVLTPNVIFAILFIGSVFYAIFSFTFFESLRVIKTSVFTTVFIAVPFLTMVISALTQGVPIIPSYIVIALGVVAGIAIQRFAPKNSGNFITSKRHKAKYGVSMYDVTSAFINTRRVDLKRTMHGGGRILAFYTQGSNKLNISKEELDSMGGEGCVLFTDKHHPNMLSSDELEFIRDITGATDDHMIVMGSGNPDEVTDKFSAVDKMLCGRRGEGSGNQGLSPL